MTKREVEVHLVGIRPKPPVSSGYHRSPTSQQCGFEEAQPLLESNRSESRPDEPIVGSQATPPKQAEPTPTPPVRPRRRGRIEPTSPSRCNFHFEAESSLAEKIERLAQVLGVVDTKGQLHALFETAVDIALKKKDPRQKHERRQRREAKKAAESAETPTPPRPDDVADAKAESAPATRHIPASVRGQVMADADYRCEFVGPDGRRCSSRVTLEADHVHPFAKGGRHNESNLRCLCQPHNLLHAEHHYGREFIQRQIQRN